MHADAALSVQHALCCCLLARTADVARACRHAGLTVLSDACGCPALSLGRHDIAKEWIEELELVKQENMVSGALVQ